MVLKKKNTLEIILNDFHVVYKLENLKDVHVHVL